MDVNTKESTLTTDRPGTAFGFDRLAQLLGGWQAAELRAARGFPECRGLSAAQLEDLYQDTALALLSRSYASEEHLRNALRHGIRRRALNMHRDQRRRREILAEHAPTMHREAQAAQTRPEDAALAAQDRLIAKEFLAELEPLERQVFALSAEGLCYRAIATTLRIPVNQARTAARASEHKRARFQLLYETGRLCGYRVATLETLKHSGGSLRALEQAKAHLAACPACRAAGVPRRPASEGAASGVLVGVLAGAVMVWSWARKVAGNGGLTIKATAAVVTAAVVAGSTLGVGQRHGHTHRRASPLSKRGTGVVSQQKPRGDQVIGSERRTSGTRSKPLPRTLHRAHRFATNESERVNAAVPAVARQPIEQGGLNSAQREFGPEK
jgi:RNA polymerase sigma factor (sigma-70 family)